MYVCIQSAHRLGYLFILNKIKNRYLSNSDILNETYKLNQIDNWSLSALLLLELSKLLGSDQRPQFVQINFGPELVLATQMEVPHANLAEITRMVFVEVDAVMVHATSVTATSRMLAVLADTAVTVADMTTKLPGLLPLDIRLQAKTKKTISIICCSYTCIQSGK